jgi:hypothetical protein
MFHSRSLRFYGRSLTLYLHAHAMPLRQWYPAPSRQISRHPEIIRLGFGDAGIEVALRPGAGAPIVQGIDTYLPLSDTHRHSQGEVRVNEGPRYLGRWPTRQT